MKKFKLGDYVAKISGSQWVGRIVGEYSTELTPEGYAVESSTERGSVQIYPAKALELAERQSQRKPLTDAEIATAIATAYSEKPMTIYDKRIARAIERAHGIGSEE